MYESSSESSIEHGNFPSVINLYAAGKKEESLSDMSDYAATNSSTSSDIRYQPISYVEDISQTNFLSPVPLPMPKSQIYFAQDRMGNCGSPVSSSSDSDTDSDATCNAEKERRNSTTSTSTNSSDEDRLPKTVRSVRARASQSTDAPYSTPNKSGGIYHITNVGHPIIHHPLSKEIVQVNPDPLLLAQSSPSSRTASSSNSGKTVRLSGRRVVVGDGRDTQLIMGHIPQSCQYLQNRVECSLSRGAAESIGLHSQAADSGISNTSPETQSSTEFYQRKLHDTIISGKVSHSSSGRFSVPSIGITGTGLGPKIHHTTRLSSGQYPQSILKFSKDHFSLIQITADFKNYLFNIISTMYAMLLLTISIVLPVIEITSPHVFFNTYEGFYIFLYVVGIMFLVYIYGYLLRDQTISRFHLGPLCSRQVKALNTSIQVDNTDMSTTLALRSEDQGDRFCEMNKIETGTHDIDMKRFSLDYDLSEHHYDGWGGLLLRLTVLGMGVVSMIRDGLLFGRVLDTSNSPNSSPAHCSSSQVAVRCLFSLIYTFIQLYFIFINSKICTQKFQVIARLGLMHMIGVNLSGLFKTVIKDSIFEQNIEQSEVISNSKPFTTLSPTRRLLKQEGLFELKVPSPEMILNLHTTIAPEKNWTKLLCHGGDLMDGIIQASDPYIYPCTVQYCLITAALLWLSWRNIESPNTRFDPNATGSIQESSRASFQRRKRHLISTTECAGSKKGIFVGLVTMIAAIVDLVVFHILVQKPNLRLTALRISYSFEIALIMSATVATVLACFKMQDLLFQPRFHSRCITQRLEETLLLISMVAGIYLHSISNIVVGRLYSDKPPSPFLLIGSLLSLLQASVQSIFICTGLRRVSYKTIHERDKPGRELVAFLLLANTALWCLHLFEQRKLDNVSFLHHKVFGQWTWAVISHVTIPLILMFRMVSIIALAVIWKQAYQFESA